MWTSARSDKVKVFHLAVTIGVVFWTGILFGLYWWASSEERGHFDETVRLKAESTAQYTQALRRWIGVHGGVYIEVGGKIKPYPLLALVPERDLETPSGRKLTLLNSPAVLREILRDFESVEGDQVKLVSFQPMNPSNMPDDWEKKALNELESGADKVQAIVSVHKKSYFHLMYPIKIKPKCLKCHYYKSKTPKNIVGGLSVIIDKSHYDKLSEEALNKIRMGYIGVWIVGLFGLVLFDFTGTCMLRKIEFIARHDGLTGLNSRREIERLLNLECERVGRYADPLTVMMLDIDHFKQVNDTYGHQAGDEALRVVAETIRQTIRNTDFAGRYGGEEFLLLCPFTSIEGARKLAQRFNAAIKSAQIRLKDEKIISVTVSIGVSCYSSEIKSAESLVKSADEALYQAKESGRDRVCFS